MKAFSIILTLLMLQLYPHALWAEGAKDCSCPQVSCGPCQKKVTVGKVVKFCDWGDINVCRKVVCENVNYYFGCLSKLNKNATPKDGDAEQSELELVYDHPNEKPSKDKKPGKRAPALASTDLHRSEKVLLETEGRIEADNASRVIEGETHSDLVIGKVESLGQGLEVLHRGQRRALKKGTPLFIGDEIFNHSGKDSKLKISFDEGYVNLTVVDKSKLIVHDPHSIVGRFQPFLYLVHGGVDFDVTMSKGSFDLLAGQILTRAEKGKHSVKYEMDGEGLKVRVESFADSLDVIRAQDLSGNKINVKAGNFVSWVSETPKHLFTADEKQALAGEGFITPVFEMSADRRQQLGLIPPPKKALFSDWSQKPENKANRDPASFVGDELCQAPAAGFQQCAWTCEGNGKGAKHCQAEKDSVHCVRRVCNAAGQWGVPTAFASSYSDLCPASGVRVGDCSP